MFNFNEFSDLDQKKDSREGKFLGTFLYITYFSEINSILDKKKKTYNEELLKELSLKKNIQVDLVKEYLDSANNFIVISKKIRTIFEYHEL